MSDLETSSALRYRLTTVAFVLRIVVAGVLVTAAYAPVEGNATGRPT